MGMPFATAAPVNWAGLDVVGDAPPLPVRVALLPPDEPPPVAVAVAEDLELLDGEEPPLPALVGVEPPPPPPLALVQLPWAKLAWFCWRVEVKPATRFWAMDWASWGTFETTASMRAWESVDKPWDCCRTVSQRPACSMADFLPARLVTRVWALDCRPCTVDCSDTASVSVSWSVPCTVLVPDLMVLDRSLDADVRAPASPLKLWAASLRAVSLVETSPMTPWMVARSRSSTTLGRLVAHAPAAMAARVSEYFMMDLWRVDFRRQRVLGLCKLGLVRKL
ncbi:hypothetical protein FJTKL_02552 [Diaporthe vaccinii]|uniref:Secreted protein n=1 Tax=Diaporthe vaccinii TaxID=105482 RepID=A0ABR4DY62_9PEZI